MFVPIGSYPPVTPPGQVGPFFVNTYFLRPDRKQELKKGGTAIRVSDVQCNLKNKVAK